MSLPALEANKLRQDLESFFANSDPKGPDAGPIGALHRGHDGYITFHSALNPDGTPNGKIRQTVAIRADALEGMFPQFSNALMEDAYFSINAFAVPKSEQGKALTNSLSVYKSTMTRYLCAAHVDIDCYARGLTVGQAIGQVIDAQIEKKMPSPSVYAHSGRGLWLFWFLRDEENPRLPPRAFPRNVILWTAIERKVLSLFNGAGADSNAARTTTITRIPGSENSKSGDAVKWLIAGQGGNAYTYTLAELAGHFGVTQADQSYAIAARRIPNNATGYTALHRGRLEQFEVLRQLRGGFREGHRHNAVMLYAQLLRKNRVPEDELIASVERLAAECIPPHDIDKQGRVIPITDEAVRTAVSVLERDRGFKFRNEWISDSLDITVEEHERLRATFGEKAWPPKGAGPRVVNQDGTAQQRRQQEIAARRILLVRLFSENPLATYRQLSGALRSEGFSGSSVRSVMLELNRLGLKTRAVLERETAHQVRQLQESMLTGCGRLPTRRGR